MKNDHTYEYRVFTNRLVDVGPMEVGNCTSKVIENLKSKDKVDGRFFHTSDSNEWFFCWDGKLQELNLSGNASVNEALKEVRELIKKADDAVKQAQDASHAANEAVKQAQEAAKSANDAAESIENKADQDYVDAVKQDVESLEQEVSKKANQTAVDELSAKVEAFPLKDENALKNVLDDYATKENIANFITIEDVLSVDGLATTKYVDEKVAEIKVPSIDNLATKKEMEGVKTWVNEQGFLTEHQDITGKQDVISDLETIRSGAAAGATALQSIPKEYVTETELNNKGYLTEQSLNGYATESFVSEEIKKIVIPDAPNMDDYYTKGDIDTMIGNINNMIGQATDITNRILNKQ